MLYVAAWCVVNAAAGTRRSSCLDSGGFEATSLCACAVGDLRNVTMLCNMILVQ